MDERTLWKIYRKTDPLWEVVLIAEGTGVAPFVVFMEDSLVKGLDGNIWLHYGA